MTSISRIAILLMACVAPLAAQVVPETTGITWPAALSFGTATRCRAANLTGHVIPDLIVRTTTGLYVATAPDVRNEVSDLSVVAGVRDFDVIPGASGARDALACVGTAGLVRLAIVNGIDSGEIVPTTLARGAWLQATRVVTADLDGDLLPDFIGLRADGVTLEFATGATGYEVSSSWAMTAPVRDFVAVDWDGDGDDEVGVALGNRLCLLGNVLSANRTDLTLLPLDLATAHVARVRGGSVDAFACAGSTTGGPHALVAFASTAPASVGHIAAWCTLSAAPCQLTSARIDPDVHGDLLVGTVGGTGFTVFGNQTLLRPGMPMFIADGLGRFDVDLQSAGRPADVAAIAQAADFDGDGDGDIGYVPVTSGNQRLAMAYNSTVSATRGANFTHSDATPGTIINITLINPDPEGEAPATHVEFLAWPVQDFGSGNSPVPAVGAVGATRAVCDIAAPEMYIQISEAKVWQYPAFYCLIRKVVMVGGVVTRALPAQRYVMHVLPGPFSPPPHPLLPAVLTAFPAIGPSISGPAVDSGIIFDLPPVGTPPPPSSTTTPPTQPGP